MVLKSVAALAAVFAAYLLLQPGDAPPTDGPVEVRSKPVDLYSPPRPDRPRRVDALDFLAGLELESDAHDFGGFSGLAISEDGGRLLALSDAGSLLDARLVLREGLPVALEDAHLGVLLGPDGLPLEDEARDSEGLLVDVDGALVSFEQRHRVWFYRAADPWRHPSPLKGARPLPLSLPEDVLRQPANGGLEAVVRLKDGRLLLFSEAAPAGEGYRRAWLISGDGVAAPLAYAAPLGFGATAAALLPEGDILLMQRRYSVIDGVAIELIRIAADAVAPEALLAGTPVARLAPPLSVDNMEGLAVRKDAAGRTLIYLISDDNFNFHQRTLLLVFALR